jgi:hypothetical protein
MTEQLTPEDLARIERIEAETAARAEQENEGIAGAKGYLVVAGVLLLYPFLIWPMLKIWFGDVPGLQWLLALAPLQLPLIAFAVIAWRRGRLDLPHGRALEGRRLRTGLLVLVLAPLVLGLGWELLRGPLWSLALANPFLAELFDGY